MRNMTNRSMTNLDVLRSVAITLVVVDHTLLSRGIERCHSWYIGDVGLFGVYLFFVHTSLVLMWSLERRPNTLDFYVRRIFRIYPLAVLTILIAAATHAPVSSAPFHYFHAVAINRKALIFNLLLIFDLKWSIPPIHGVTWSLPPELYMYLLLPVLFVYAHTVRKIWPLLGIWLLVVCFDTHFFDVSVGNNFPVLIPDFLCGVIAYVGFMRKRQLLPAWVLLPLLAILFAGYMSLHEIRADWYACLVLALVLPYLRQCSSTTTERTSHTIAKYSYGMYLFHPFSIVLGMYLLAGRPLALQLAVEVVTLVALSVAGYHAIEAPMIRLGARVAARLAGESGLPSAESLEALEPAP
jgi:peptidoglycan/LPS O-acetylase OafA/YrhL